VWSVNDETMGSRVSGLLSVNDRSHKVVVRATGVGRYAIRTNADRPNLELVGAWVYSAQKDGLDVGHGFAGRFVKGV
jgi:hypothetical protein